MLNEAKKREKVANAFLAAAMAASDAQSPKDFVRTGHIEAPGTALMQMFGKKRAEAERNLDSGRVVARNIKRKTFKEFVEEAYIVEARVTHRDTIGHKEYDAWRDEVSTHHAEHGHVRGVSRRTFDGVEYEMRNKARKGKPKIWAVSKVSDRKSSAEKRRQALKPISDQEFLDYAKRNLKKNPKEVAAVASDVETQTKKSIKKAAKERTEKTGEKYEVDHIHPQPTRRRLELQPRFQRVSPGDAAAGLRVMKSSKNSSRQDIPPKKGDPKRKLTRSAAIASSIRKGEKLLSKIDKLSK